MAIRLEVGKRYRTRGGSEVEILAENPHADYYPMVGAYMTGYGGVGEYMRDGSSGMGEKTSEDLIEEIRPKRVVWVNVYPEIHRVGVFSSREQADDYAVSDRIACQRVEIEEGRFDDE